MKNIFSIVLSVAIVAMFAAIPLGMSQPVYADGVDVFNEACTSGSAANSELCTNNQELFGANSIWTNIINVLIFIVGAVAVLMIIIGGLRYVLSGGDQSAVNSAKNTILYSIVGVVVAFLSFAIVNFVINTI